jgi:hypothetical protein
MKVSQLKQVLSQAGRLYRESGRDDLADALETFASLTTGRETMTVPAFTRLIAQAAADARNASGDG